MDAHTKEDYFDLRHDPRSSPELVAAQWDAIAVLTSANVLEEVGQTMPRRREAMSGPQRIQLRRTKGWRKPEGAILVARPSRWGNPCRTWTDKQGRVWTEAPWWSGAVEQGDIGAARAVAASALSRHLAARRNGYAACGSQCWHYPTDQEIVSALRGHDLACWCPLDSACHADVLLELANAGDEKP